MDNCRVKLRPHADKDIDRHFEYLSIESSVETARSYLDALEQTLNHIAEYPQTGSIKHISNRTLPSVRMWPVKHFKRFLVFYLPHRAHIEVVRVLHARQDRYIQLNF